VTGFREYKSRMSFSKLSYVEPNSELFNRVNCVLLPAFGGNQDVKLRLINEGVYFKPKRLEQALSLGLFRKLIQREEALNLPERMNDFPRGWLITIRPPASSSW